MRGNAVRWPPGAPGVGGEIAGEAVHETVKAWVWNNEDDKPELRRRLAAVMRQWDVAPGDLRGRLGLNSGAASPLVVARATRDGAVLRLPAFAAVIDRVRADGIGLLIVDPFVETHEADENDNVQIKAVAAMWRDVARLCDCAVVLVHYTGKPPPAAPDGWAGSLSASRGASSLAGVARIMRTLFAMSQSDAGKLGVSDGDRRLWVRHVTGKGNAPKDEVVRAVRALGFQPADDNEANALAILSWAMANGIGGGQ
ncbi:MAG: AAA family ATPase [Aestuariivirga sp.]|uniref:AAA family ATPase n=1 Tax=Aestuariivirga sp. TaxID=2650926 RepID=UPI0038D1BB97